MKKQQILMRDFVYEIGKKKIFSVKIIVYPTIRSILKEYLMIDKFENNKYIIEGFTYREGKKWRKSLTRAIKEIKYSGQWGFYRFQTKEIHLWFKRNIDKRDLCYFLAHEIGHSFNPRHKSPYKEEEKAIKYEHAALYAYDLATEIIQGIKKKELK